LKFSFFGSGDDDAFAGASAMRSMSLLYGIPK